jgi:hypothetical protein
MSDEWRPIQSFTDYIVSDDGYVRNEKTGRFMAQSTNQRGIVVVGLTKELKQYTRAIAPIVGLAFLEPRPNDYFNSVINLDGDRFNNNASNLVWRPLWFVRKYFQQFQEPEHTNYYPIEETKTGERFYNPWAAAVKYGLLRSDIVLAIRAKIEVWPTGQRFEMTGFRK